MRDAEDAARTGEAQEHTIVFGRQPAKEAFSSGRNIERVYIVSSARGPEIKEIKRLAWQHKVRLDIVPTVKLNKIAKTKSHQGVALIVSPVTYLGLEEWLDQLGEKVPALVVVLDRVQNASNVGLIIRNAACAGADGVILPLRGGALVDATAMRISAGTALRIPIVRSPHAPQILRRLKKAGFWVYGFEPHADLSVFDVNWPERTALVFGNEHAGMRDVVRKECDELVCILLADGMDSLNVAVAAGIGLFDVKRKHGAQP